MKYLLTLGLLLSGLVLAQPAAARYAHCYTGPAPEGTLPTPEGFSMEDYALGFAIRPVIYRKLCGLTNEDDAAFIRMVYQYPGCTPESDIGRAMEDLVAADVGDLPGMGDSRYERLVTNHAEYHQNFCRMVSELPWPAYDASYQPISPDIQQRFQSKMREIEDYKSRYWEAVRDAAGSNGSSQ
ncbi:MAG: hypothetical protein ACMVY4_10090 [Minwuia sp.]|uniref:hypothetical protein n=1 Tax=Minwuia sp. TaxID=2493630 RepID=UPI003A895B06